jgi:hypothetical protein
MPTKTITINIETSSTEELLAFYNANSGTKALASFKDRADAEKRVADLVEAHNELATGASKGSKAKGKKAPAPAKGKKGAKAPAPAPAKGKAKAAAVKVSGGAAGKFARAGGKFFKLVEANPRREGTHGFKSFNLLKNGMTYEEYIAAGGRNNDLRWDIDHGWVEQRIG